ncbi:MAG: Cu(I)/Ag(I) efflux system membrane fusion protein [Bacteroidia bacterium]|jgi:Cu(I)/Ag(I) efflux system membrane fusion protein
MKRFNKASIVLAIATLAIGLFVGALVFKTDSNTEEHNHSNTKDQTWTCSMHPQIRQSKPGQCPICGMDLIPVNVSGDVDGNPMEIVMTPTAMQLANIQTTVIKKRKPVKEVRMTGKVQVDERKKYVLSSHIPGRLERLQLSFTGESVRKGQTIGYVYSPDLVTAQEELIQANKYRESQPGLFQAAKEKLANWKISIAQIDDIVLTGKIVKEFPIVADHSGIVLLKKIELGDYIQKGQTLFEIADLSSVWVQFDVHESDMAWVKKGNTVEYHIQSMPGKQFNGRIQFIDPVVNPSTRVANARIEVNNQSGFLKPEMFATGIVKSPVGKISEEIIVPKSAVMWTGERSIVYVKTSAEKGIAFMLRKVTLGTSLGDDYVIKDGLEEGEEIATNGTFSIDAAAQLAGKPSMMNPDGGAIMTGHNHGGTSKNKTGSSSVYISNLNPEAKIAVQKVITSYLVFKDNLVTDDYEQSKISGALVIKEIDIVNMALFKGQSHEIWMKYQSQMLKHSKAISNSKTIDDLRESFKLISIQMVGVVKSFGPFDETLYVQNCPMANSNKGADWLSQSKNVLNPYFGQSMLTCGSTIQIIN